MSVPADLAPTGALRIGLVEGPVAGAFVCRPAAGGSLPEGIPAFLAARIAAAAGLATVWQFYGGSGACTDALAEGTCDLSFLPKDAVRARRLAFGPAYFRVESVWLAAARCPARTAADLDRPEARLVAIAGTTTARAAAATLRHARLAEVESIGAALEKLEAGAVDALAFSREGAAALLPRLPGAQILSGVFQRTTIALALPPGRPAARDFAAAQVDCARQEGILLRAFAAAGLETEGLL